MTETAVTPATPSTPAKPVAAPTLVQTVEKDYAWVKMHIAALLVTFVLIGGSVVGSVYGVESLIAKHDLATEQRYNTALAGEVANTKAAQDALATTIASFNTQLQALQAQNVQLTQSIAARNAQTQKQVKIDATLDAAETAQRLSTQTSASAGQVQVAPNGSDITVALPITRSIVADLDSLQSSQANLVDTQKELDNTNQLFTSSQQVVAAQKKTIDAQDAQIAGQVKACQTEVDTVKSQARKGKIKWFFIGYVAGFISGRVVLPVK